MFRDLGLIGFWIQGCSADEFRMSLLQFLDSADSMTVFSTICSRGVCVCAKSSKLACVTLAL